MCFQFPPVFLSGVAIVISPLLSLMADQLHNLRRMGIKAASLSGTSSLEDVDAVVASSPSLVYVTPEFLCLS